jgi:hypothetical protein
MNLRNFIETYPLKPDGPGAHGSVTITNGVKITAHANFNYIASRFGKEESDNLYHFSY